MNKYSDLSGSDKVGAMTGTHSDGSKEFKGEDWDVHQNLLAKHYGTIFDVCEGLVADPGRCCSYYIG